MTMTTTSRKPTGKLAELAKIQRGGNKLILPLVQEHLLARWGPDPDRDATKVHVSEMAKKDWCERATWHRIRTGVWPEERFSFTLSSIFDEGHQIHDKWQTWLADTGKLWGDWRCEACGRQIGYVTRGQADSLAPKCILLTGHLWRYQEVSLQYGLISGHEDAAVDDRLVEFKSVGIGTLRRDNPALLAKYYVQTVDGKKIYDLDALWAGLKQPLMSHVRQANLYMWLAQRMAEWLSGSGFVEAPLRYASFRKCSIVYEYKPNQQSREYVIPLSMDIVQPLLDRVEALHQPVPPPCPYGGCTQCQAYDDHHPAPPRASRRLVHRPSGLSDRGDGPAAGPVLGGGGRLHRGRRAESGPASGQPRPRLPQVEASSI